MLLIGLTGTLASGKSTVAQILSSPPHNLPLIDADALARQAVQPGSLAYTAIVREFGPSTPDLLLLEPTLSVPSHPPASPSHPSAPAPPPPLSPLNRAALGRRVFGRSPARTHDRARLNAIVHPAVRRLMLWQLLYHHMRGAWAVVADVPLLFEGGLDVYCGVVITVLVRSRGVLMGRLRERNPGLSVGEAEERVGSQMGGGEKEGRTRGRGEGRGVVVFNDGGVGELRGRVGEVVGGLERGRKGVWRWWLWGSPVGAVVVAFWFVFLGWRDRRRWERGRERERGGKEE